MKRFVIAGIAVAQLTSARADERPLHGSIGAGGALVLTGNGGDRFRGEATIDIKPRSRFGGLLAWRAFDQEHDGIVMAGIVFEAAAARPRLLLDLHGDLGFDLDTRDPVLGGGLRTTVGVIGPLAVVLDSGLYLVIDGLEDSRVQLQSSALVAVRW